MIKTNIKVLLNATVSNLEPWLDSQCYLANILNMNEIAAYFFIYIFFKNVITLF